MRLPWLQQACRRFGSESEYRCLRSRTRKADSDDILTKVNELLANLVLVRKPSRIMSKRFSPLQHASRHERGCSNPVGLILLRFIVTPYRNRAVCFQP